MSNWDLEKTVSMSSAHRVNALLCYFLGHRHSHSPQYPSPVSYTSVHLTYLTARLCHICNFKRWMYWQKVIQYSSTLVKPNLTSEEKHVNDSNSALFYNLCSWTRSLIFIGTAPEMQPQNPFYHRCNRGESSSQHKSSLLPCERVIQVSYEKTFFHVWSSSSRDEQIIWLHYIIFCFS